ncbi:MAG: hypothetical protein AAGH15_01985 [Myxococcota bacterium]
MREHDESPLDAVDTLKTVPDAAAFAAERTVELSLDDLESMSPRAPARRPPSDLRPGLSPRPLAPRGAGPVVLPPLRHSTPPRAPAPRFREPATPVVTRAGTGRARREDTVRFERPASRRAGVPWPIWAALLVGAAIVAASAGYAAGRRGSLDAAMHQLR